MVMCTCSFFCLYVLILVHIVVLLDKMIVQIRRYNENALGEKEYLNLLVLHLKMLRYKV